MLRPEVDSDLLKEIKTAYPEVEALSAADIIGWAFRKLIQEKRN